MENAGTQDAVSLSKEFIIESFQLCPKTKNSNVEHI